MGAGLGEDTVGRLKLRRHCHEVIQNRGPHNSRWAQQPSPEKVDVVAAVPGGSLEEARGPAEEAVAAAAVAAAAVVVLAGSMVGPEEGMEGGKTAQKRWVRRELMK